MDPNETLVNIRTSVRGMFRAAANGDYLDASSIGYDLAEDFEALDEWLSKGGFLPKEWSAAMIPASFRTK